MKRLVSVAVVLMALWLFMPSVLEAQLYPEWGDSYSGSSNLDDVAVDLVTVGDTLCVVGNEETSSNQYKIVVRKYGPDGSLIVQGQFPPPELVDTVITVRSFAITALSNGRFAVGGTSRWEQTLGWRGLLVVFNSDLSVFTQATFTGTYEGNNNNLFYVAYDQSQDCIYGAGEVSDTSSPYNTINLVVVKYSIEVQPLWGEFPRYSYDSWDQLHGFALDEDGNSYLTSRNDAWDEISTISFDSAGNLRWSDVFTGPLYTICYDLSVDSLGRVHIIGMSGYPGVNAIDLVYSLSGDSLETFVYPNAYFVSVALDENNNRYYTGCYRVSENDEYQALAVKVNSQGQIQWDFLWVGNPAYSHETYRSVLDNYGRLVLCDKGYLRTGPYTYVFKEYNFLALDPTGGDLVGHAQTLVIEDSSLQNSPCLTTNESGEIYFCGQFSDSGLDLDWAVIKFVPFVTGEASGDRLLRPNDITRTVGFLKGNWDLWPPFIADVNGDCEVSLADATYYFSYFTVHGYPPQYCPFDLDTWYSDQIGP